MANKKDTKALVKVSSLPQLTSQDVVMGSPEIDITKEGTLFICNPKSSRLGPMTSNKIIVKDIRIKNPQLDLRCPKLMLGGLEHIRFMKMAKAGVHDLIWSSDFSLNKALNGTVPLIYCMNGKIGTDMPWKTKEIDSTRNEMEYIFSLEFEHMYPLEMHKGVIDLQDYPEIWKEELLTRFQFMIEQLGLEVYG